MYLQKASKSRSLLFFTQIQEEMRTNMRTNIKIIAIIGIFIAIVTLITITIMSIGDNPPLDGYISRKTSHPAYYPAHFNTPIVYCLGITAHSGQMAASWKVSKEVYDSYNVGDLTGHPTNLKGAVK